MIILFAFSFLAGIFTALSPCILPVLPAIMASGVGQGKFRPLGTVIGLVMSFALFTLSLSWIVQLTGISPQFLRNVAIGLVFLFGLVMIFPQLSNRFADWTSPVTGLGRGVQGSKPATGLWGGILFGAALGLLWTPCAGPILAAITVLVASGGVNLTAILMTLFYGVGAAIPMFLYAYGSSRLIQTSQVLSHYSERIRQFFGVLMLLFAVALSFNWDMLFSKNIAKYVPEILSEKILPITSELQILTGAESIEIGEEAPRFTDVSAWINTQPLTMELLKGKVVLIDFWTYSCINCLRTLPFLKEWDKNYRDKGLVIVGVHTPEFAFEKDLSNVKTAVDNLGVLYPVALDNDYGTWRAYHNHYWPAHYLIDQKGIVRMIHFGEGAYGETENAIRDLLGMPPVEVLETKTISRPLTPETYLGSARADRYAITIHPGTYTYSYKAPLVEDHVGLQGAFRMEEEAITSEGHQSFLDLNFLASHVYLVLSGKSTTPIEVQLDGKSEGQIFVDGDKKYDVVNTTYGRHQLSLKIPKGIKAYAFTFGD